MLDALTYERAVVARGEEQVFSDQDIEKFAKLNSSRKHISFRKVDENDKKRRERQLGLLEEIKNRSVEFA